MPRGRGHKEEPNDTQSDFLDWEPNDEMVRKILGTMKTHSVRDALLTLIATCNQLTKGSPKDWENTKVKQVLEEI